MPTHMTRNGKRISRNVFKPGWQELWQGNGRPRRYGSNKGADARCAGTLSPKKAAGTTITFCGGCMEAKISWLICNCYIPTAIGKAKTKSCREEKPRPARGVREGLSRMRGKLACPVLRGQGDRNASLLPDLRASASGNRSRAEGDTRIGVRQNRGMANPVLCQPYERSKA